MALYVDGYVIPIAKKNLKAYIKLAKIAGKVWHDHGALQYRECAAEDMQMKMGTPFGKLAKLKPTDTLVFSWVVFKSKADRNRINAKVMKDPRLAAMMNLKAMPFDVKRMSYGGFKLMVDA